MSRAASPRYPQTPGAPASAPRAFAALPWEGRKFASRAVVFFALLVLVALPSRALDRHAFSFPRYDLEAIVDPHQHALSVQGTIELRNISREPQAEAALQISSSLRWLAVLADGQPVEWLTQSYTSDIDHTGLLSEAIVKLPHPLEPGATLLLEVRYSGSVPRDATRLERIGMPRPVAERSDWDEISDGFTALRGAGFVVWYPVAMEAASLSQGEELYETLRDWRERQSSAVLRVTLRTSPGAQPLEASAAEPSDKSEADYSIVGNGVPVAPATQAAGSATASANQRGVLTEEFRGADPVIVMLNDAASTTRPNVDAYYTAAHTSLARDYMAAAEAVVPPLEEWFGAPKRKVVLVELPDPDALPYQAGSYYFVPLRRVPRAAAEVAMARPVAAAMLESPRAWIREGLASFAQALIRERQSGRGAALEYLGQFSSALVIAEAQSHGSPAEAKASGPALPTLGSQPLVVTTDEIFLHTKAAYVWWMLREMVGDRRLQAALAAYRAADDRDTGYMQRLIEVQFTPRRDLETFFDEWVYRDRGLPQLRVASAYARRTLGAQTVTAVTVENLGEAGCEVPVIVRSDSAEARVRLLVPAKGHAIVRVPLDATPTAAEVNDGSVPESSHDGHVVPISRPSSAQ